MFCHVDFRIAPIGTGDASFSKHVADCVRILKKYGLTYQLHATGTNIEGEWEAIAPALQQCHELLHSSGCPRVSSTVSLTTRTDKVKHLNEQVTTVESMLRAEE
ncbi:hypothetical protein HK102_006523 [Quaeritorhiza haematococci]|nr:hypothetical protein HK102_006523 [Quaeritorhiza haematococci]